MKLIAFVTCNKFSKNDVTREWIPPLTEQYKREVDYGKKKLSETEKSQGYELIEEDTDKRGKKQFIVCRWNMDYTTTTYNGLQVERKKGELKKTWEVLAMNGLANYHIESNPAYKVILGNYHKSLSTSKLPPDCSEEGTLPENKEKNT